MLEFTGISHHYHNGGNGRDTPSVHGISLAVRKGMVTSLLGPSGCGKSTLLRLAAGLEVPDAGQVRIDGEVVADADSGLFIPPEARRIGLVFQDYALFPHMTVGENILYGLDGAGVTAAAARATRLKEVLEQVDMGGFADAMPHMLSGGQQQRVALARALAPKPKLMLLDEPYAGLDSRLRESIRDDMLHVLRQTGATVLMVTHDSEEAMFMSDEIHLMRDGHIEQGGRPIDLYCRPQSAFVAEFFGEVNRVDGPVIGGKLQTPFGAFRAAPGAERAALVIRHEGLRIGTGDAQSAPRAEVMEARVLGRYSLVHLSMRHDGRHPAGKGKGGGNGGKGKGKGGGGKTRKGEAEELHLHARVPGLNMLKPGEVVTLSVDEAQVFVFSG